MTGDRNELFRTVNENIADVRFDLVEPRDELREFLCECGRIECRTLFAMTWGDYRDARTHSSWFLVAPEHDDDEHDRVVERHPTYWVVETTAPAPTS